MTIGTLVIHKSNNSEDTNYIREGLVKYNAPNVSENIRFNYEEIRLKLKDERGQIYGGITGAVKWNFIKIDFLWLDEQVRGYGYGKTLLQEIEKLAKEKNCDLIEVDTFSFQAPDFYMKNGYEVIGVVEDAPRGHAHYYLVKRLKN